MAYKEKTKKAKRSNYGSKRSTSDIDWAAVHYTGTDGGTAANNGDYFKNNYVGASAHDFIDEVNVIHSVPYDHIAWSVGSVGLLDQGSPYAHKGAKYWGKCTNANSISFELCDTIKNGKIMVSEKTRANAVEHIAKKMVEFDIPISHLIRHFDVNGKLCPIYYVTNEDAWNEFKADVKARMDELKSETKKKKKKYSGTFPKLPGKGYFEYGSNGKQVKYLQKFLNWFGGYGLKVDGIIGEKTIVAIKAFQEACGLVVDGLFGKKSLAKAKKVKK